MNLPAGLSLDELKLLLNKVSDSIYMFDSETLKFTYLNQSAIEMLGYGKDEFYNITPVDTQPECSKETFENIILPLKTGQKLSVSFRTKHRNKKGDSIPAAVYLQQITSADKSSYFLAIVKNISKLKKTEEKKESQRLHFEIDKEPQAEITIKDCDAWLRSLINAMPECICLKDGNGRILEANHAFLSTFYLDREAYKTKKCSELTLLSQSHQDLFANCANSDELAWLNSMHISTEKMLRMPGGEERIFSFTKIPLFFPEGGRKGIVMLGRDVTSQRKLEEDLLLFAKVFDSTIEGIVLTDNKGVIKKVNSAFTRITKYSQEEVIGKNTCTLKSDRHGPAFYKEMWNSLNRNGTWSGEIWSRGKYNKAYHEWLSISVIKDFIGNPTHYMAAFCDLTDINNEAAKLKYQANHDPLTGLPNRQLFNDRMDREIIHAHRSKTIMALMFLDLDGFKNINDTFGHDVGDVLLQQIAQRLTRCARESDTVSRLGGDEFTMILADTKNGIADAIEVAERVIDSLGRPFEIKGRKVQISTSIGITLYPSDGFDVATLMKNADLAMYRAKRRGKGKYEIFSSELRAKLQKSLIREQEFRLALANQSFKIYYHPKIAMKTGEISGVEALVRWPKSETECLNPSEFLPMAEATGLIIPLGRWILTESCRQIKEWHEKGFEHLTLAVNLSAKQFQDEGFSAFLDKVLLESGLPAQSLNLEITENTVTCDVEKAIVQMDMFARRGVNISLDDFGTGYSSLHLLKRFPLNILKIDKSFVHDVPKQSEGTAITRTIISMAKDLKLRVVAEGVENEGQYEYLRHEGCDELQGYYFSKPLKADAFYSYLKMR